MARFDNATSFITPVDPDVATKTWASIAGVIRSNFSLSSAGMRGLRRRWEAADSKSIMGVIAFAPPSRSVVGVAAPLHRAPSPPALFAGGEEGGARRGGSWVRRTEH